MRESVIIGVAVAMAISALVVYSLAWYHLHRKKGNGMMAREIRNGERRYVQQVAKWEAIEAKYPGEYDVQPRSRPPRCIRCGVHVRHTEFATHSAWHKGLELEIGDAR